MNRRLYVGNLDWSATERDLRDAFSRYGDVEHVLLCTDRETGQSRGFGFVTFRDSGAAIVAERALNGSPFVNGRSLRVKEAEERPNRGPSDRGQGPSSAGDRGRGSREQAARSTVREPEVIQRGSRSGP